MNALADIAKHLGDLELESAECQYQLMQYDIQKSQNAITEAEARMKELERVGLQPWGADGWQDRVIEYHEIQRSIPVLVAKSRRLIIDSEQFYRTRIAPNPVFDAASQSIENERRMCLVAGEMYRSGD